MNDIKQMGAFYRIDREGYIINETGWRNISSDYREVIETAVDRLTSNIQFIH
ncbi:hypothetical protein ABFG93_09710 [Pseudalkalibacillus hwajinpoensis]|uniref:hypothetical protein n=1 Tax=Guptibacillus hwajinpoensis TaxID=208199 RepID=UPI00325B1EF4